MLGIKKGLISFVFSGPSGAFGSLNSSYICFIQNNSLFHVDHKGIRVTVIAFCISLVDCIVKNGYMTSSNDMRRGSFAVIVYVERLCNSTYDCYNCSS